MIYTYYVSIIQRGVSTAQRLASYIVLAFQPNSDTAVESGEGAAPPRGTSGGRIPWTFHRLFIRGLGTVVVIAAMMINIR
mgnify:CR=1 FL=1